MIIIKCNTIQYDINIMGCESFCNRPFCNIAFRKITIRKVWRLKFLVNK